MGFRSSINAMCKGCIFDRLDHGSWRQQVTACTSRDCPLWAVRPLSKQKAKVLAPVPPEGGNVPEKGQTEVVSDLGDDVSRVAS